MKDSKMAKEKKLMVDKLTMENGKEGNGTAKEKSYIEMEIPSTVYLF